MLQREFSEELAERKENGRYTEAEVLGQIDRVLWEIILDHYNSTKFNLALSEDNSNFPNERHAAFAEYFLEYEEEIMTEAYEQRRKLSEKKEKLEREAKFLQLKINAIG